MITRPEHPYEGELGELAELLIDLEQDHHDDGWDSRLPTLYRVQLEDGEPPSWTVTPCRLGSLYGLHPRDELQGLANAVQVSDGAAMMEVIFDQPPAAHILIFEGWSWSYNSKEDRDKDAGKYFGDMEGSIESRSGFAVMGDNIICLTRKRGNEPEFFATGHNDDGEIEISGMTKALVDLHKAIARYWRDQNVGANTNT